MSTESLASIESFVKSAEHGSFSAAARKLGVTPAAVSKGVAKLEARLGVRLLQRTTRRLSLTEPGARFLREASGGLAAIESAVAALRGQNAPAGVLKVSLSPSFGRDYVLPMLGSFLDEHPQVTLDWRFANRQVDLVGEGFDVAIGAALELGAGIVARELARAHVIAVAAPSYLARHPAPRTPADLPRHDGIVPRSATTARLRVWQFADARGRQTTFDLRPRMVFDDSEAIAAAALAGLGIGLVAAPHVVGHLERGKLVRVLPGWRADVGKIFVYHAGQGRVPAKTRAFVDALVAHFTAHRLAQRFKSI